MARLLFLLFFIAAACPPASTQAQEASSAAWSTFHFQETAIGDEHAAFHSDYSGANSLQPVSQSAATLTTTLFMGAKVLPGTEVYVDPELVGGSGLSGTYGVAGFPNGEAYRVGNPQPIGYIARIFLRRTFGLGGAEEKVPDGQNQVATTHDEDRVVITAGKFALTDLFDDNAYSHDPREDFLNWALMDSGAWDYPADTHGYDWNFVAEYDVPGWSWKAAASMEPTESNGSHFDQNIGQAHGFTGQGERDYDVSGLKGTTRLLLFYNQAPMGSYQEALALSPADPNVVATRQNGRSKYGLALSADQQFSSTWGGFLRLSWNDGHNETWAFAEIDESASAGLVEKGTPWGRPLDDARLALAVNGLSKYDEEYLAAGGYGFMIGDGALDYGLETIVEAMYRWRLSEQVTLSPDYQIIVNPAYNRDRGPAQVWGARVHVEL